MELTMSTLFRTTPDRQASVALAIVRVLTGIIFIAHGAQKLFVFGLAGVSGGFAQMGIPMPGVVGPFIALLEFFGGIALVFGLLTRLASLGLLFDMLGAILLVHLKNGFFLPQGYEFALLLLGPVPRSWSPVPAASRSTACSRVRNTARQKPPFRVNRFRRRSVATPRERRRLTPQHARQERPCPFGARPFFVCVRPLAPNSSHHHACELHRRRDVAESRVFLLSPARTDGRRAQLVFNPRAQFSLAVRLREPDGARSARCSASSAASISAASSRTRAHSRSRTDRDQASS
jgi:putative oxidoreductase